jgi:hypothetical protein
MKHMLMGFVIFAVLFSGCNREGKKQVTAACIEENRLDMNSCSHRDLQAELVKLQRQYDECGTVQCCEYYVEKVINEGLDVLHLPAGLMASGYATPKDAKKIAAYVMTLSGKVPTHPEYVQDGNLYFNGNCGGCHGNDGKGLNGTYPDLTLSLLKGAGVLKYKISQDIAILQEQLKQ